MLLCFSGKPGVRETSVLQAFAVQMEITWDGLPVLRKGKAIVIQTREGRGLVQAIQDHGAVSRRCEVVWWW